MFHHPLKLFLLAIALTLSSCQSPRIETHSAPASHDQTIEALNRLRDAINAQYGFRDGVPRVNLGPCGRVAKEFREQWNARFTPQINIVFVMSQDNSLCHHVLVKLPDGHYFDGGNGVITGKELVNHYPGSHIDEMVDFDLKLLDLRSYGLKRDYPVCPNYSDEVTTRLITDCLGSLSRSSTRPF